MPIVTAIERAPNNREQLIGESSKISKPDSQSTHEWKASNVTAFEFNPWEMGSFDPTTHAFAPLEYLGSNFSAGSLPPSELCVRGLDNAGFVMGTSSSIFNQVLIEVTNFDTNNSILRNLTVVLKSILTNISESNLDIAIYQPNPFYGYNNQTNHNAHARELHLVDAALDLQNIPLVPLLGDARNIDVIFAVDSSADTGTNWPDGSSMVATYERYLDPSGIGNGTTFPAVPDQNTFVNLGLNSRPTFFGCNSSNMTGPAPIVVYIPNAPYSFLSNVSTFELTYNASTRNAIVQNGYDVATLANSSFDSSWPACVGCAILSRSLERTGSEVPLQCQRCFAKYCWHGTVESTEHAPYEPKLALPSDSGANHNAASKAKSSWQTVIAMIALEVVLLLVA